LCFATSTPQTKHTKQSCPSSLPHSSTSTTKTLAIHIHDCSLTAIFFFWFTHSYLFLLEFIHTQPAPRDTHENSDGRPLSTGCRRRAKAITSTQNNFLQPPPDPAPQQHRAGTTQDWGGSKKPLPRCAQCANLSRYTSMMVESRKSSTIWLRLLPSGLGRNSGGISVSSESTSWLFLSAFSL